MKTHWINEVEKALISHLHKSRVLISVLILLICSGIALAGTSIVCRPDGTCDIVITQDDGNGSNGGWPKPMSE